jgi:hypothetical protein
MTLAPTLGMDASTSNGTVSSPTDIDAIAHDSVVGKLDLHSESTQETMPIPESAFGYAGPIFSLTNGLWRTNSSWWNDSADVTATVDLHNVWDVQSRGRTPVHSAESPSVSSATWKDIIADLTPGEGGVPKRHVYWAPGPTMAHEQFHCKDYTDRAQAYLATAREWLASQQIDVPFFNTEMAVHRQVKPLLETLATNFTKDAKAHLDAGGEARAYNATKGNYDTLIAAIRTRAEAEGWKK